MQAPRKINIPPHVASISDDSFSLEDIPQTTIDAACVYLKKEGAVWGDVAYFASALDYRNVGCFMFDGNTLMDLCYEPIEYGSLPPPFYPIECGLPPNHWQDVIAHNNLIPIKTQTIRGNLVVPPCCGIVPGSSSQTEMVYFVFCFNGEDYTVLTEVEEDATALVKYLDDLIKNSHEPYLCFASSCDGFGPNVFENYCYRPNC